MAASYGTINGLYGHGLPRGSLVSRARLVAAVDASANLLELEGHGLSADMPVTFVVDAGGVLPAPLAVRTIYYAKLFALDADYNSEALFQVSATPGGAAIDLTTEGTAPFRLHVSPALAAAWKLEFRSRWVDGLAIGHVVPFTAPYPPVVVEVTERAAALDMLFVLGQITLDAHTAAMAGLALDGKAMLKGAPLRDATATAPANLAIGSSPADTSGRWPTPDRSVIP